MPTSWVTSMKVNSSRRVTIRSGARAKTLSGINKTHIALSGARERNIDARQSVFGAKGELMNSAGLSDRG